MSTPAILPGTASLNAGQRPDASKNDIRDVAQKFEAIFVRQMLSAARASDFGGDELFGGQGEDTFRDMQDSHFADLAAQTGAIGLAPSIEAQLARFVNTKG